LERIYGLSKLSIDETKMPPYNIRKIPANAWPVTRRTTLTGSQTSHEPRTGIIDAIIATKVRISTFGTPRKNSPAPSARPWIIPIRTCPNIIAFVIPLNSFRNLCSVASGNGESELMYFCNSSESRVAKKKVNRKTANWNIKVGRLTSISLNWVRNAVNIAPIMLSIFIARVDTASDSMKLPRISVRFRF